MEVLYLACGSLLLLLVLILFLPKRKNSQGQGVLQQYVPQYAPPEPPRPVLSARQQEVQERAQAVLGYYMQLDEARFQKQVIDEAIVLFTQSQQAQKPASPVAAPRQTPPTP